jgi:hypothetical protein
VLLLIVALGLLPALSSSEQSVADDRVLRVQEGSSARQYAVEELVAAIGLAELEVAKDPHFGPNRVFAGFALETLVNHIGLGDASELLLVCADGCRIPFDASLLWKSQLRGLLAIRETALPADAETHWAAYRHGAEAISFDASSCHTWASGVRPRASPKVDHAWVSCRSGAPPSAQITGKSERRITRTSVPSRPADSSLNHEPRTRGQKLFNQPSFLTR